MIKTRNNPGFGSSFGGNIKFAKHLQAATEQTSAWINYHLKLSTSDVVETILVLDDGSNCILYHSYINMWPRSRTSHFSSRLGILGMQHTSSKPMTSVDYRIANWLNQVHLNQFGSSSQISEDVLWMLVDSFPTWSAQWKSLRTTRHLVCHLRFCTWLVRKWVDHGGSWWTLALISQKDGLMAQHGRQVVFGPCVLVYMMYEVTICWMIRIHMCAKTYA